MMEVILIKSLLIDLFGSYVPVTYEVSSSEGVISEVIPSGLSGVDWEYVLGVLLFALTLYCVFRILGGFIKR